MNSKATLLNLWLTLMAVWLIANGSLAADVVVVGALLSTVGAIAMAGFSRAYADIQLTPKALYHGFLYLGVFTAELVKANLNVMRIVFSPGLDIEPGIVEIKTRLKSPTGRLVLANSITLTPGTLTVDIKGDSLFIHWIDVTNLDPHVVAKEIAAKFERHLAVIYG